MDKMHAVNIQYFTAKREDGGGVVAKGTLPGQGMGPGSGCQRAPAASLGARHGHQRFFKACTSKQRQQRSLAA